MRWLAPLLLSLTLPVLAQPERLRELLEQRRYDQALPLAQQAVNQSPLPENYRVLGECLFQCGHLQESQQAYEAALQSNPPDPVPFWQGLARSLSEQGKENLAQAVYEQILAAQKKSLGSKDIRVALTLNKLGGAAYRGRDYSRAESAYRQAASILEGQPDANLASVLDSLGLVLTAQRRPTEALMCFQKALALRLEHLGANHPLVADTLTNMGPVDPNQAGEHYRKALAILEKSMGPQDPSLVGLLDRTARYYEDAGDLAKAQPLYERALALSPPDSVQRAQVQEDLAGLFRVKRAWPLAQKHYEEALQMLSRELGPSHPQAVIALANYALFRQELGDLDGAFQAYERALPMLRSQADQQDFLATALLGMGQLQLRRGEMANADASLTEASQIWTRLYGEKYSRLGLVRANQAFLWHQQGDLKRAEQGYTEARELLGSSPDAESLQDSLCRLKLDQQQPEAALQLARSGLQQRRLLATNVLAYSSEAERFFFFHDFRPYDVLATLSSPETLSALLSFKGLVLDSILEDQRLAARHPEKRASLEQLYRLRREWSRMRVRSDLRELKLEIGRLEASLGSEVKHRQALTVTPEQVQKQLPEHTSLVEFVSYQHYLSAGKPAEDRMAALVLSPKGPPVFLALGNTSAIRQHLISYRLLWKRGASPNASDAILRELYQKVWLPVQRELPAGTEEVILAPDGELNALSFATLLNEEGEFLGEKLRLSYVASGRDLLAPASGLQRKSMVMICNPDFGQASPNQSYFEPLPGTAREAALLEPLAKAAGLTVTTVTQRKATEEYVRNMPSPGILHLATHGFLLPEGSYQGLVALRRGGLALVGAQSTLEHWARGDYPDPQHDGILNAEEIATVALNNTWLVTLSACDTATGKTIEGEGVLGLRRGFAQAGAQNLLLTLWPIADQETADFMKDFYSRALRSGSARNALAQTQREWLRRLRQSGSAVRAARLAGPFVLNFKGSPK